jgi:hypothetical protein
MARLVAVCFKAAGDQFDAHGDDEDRPDYPPPRPVDNANLIEKQQSAQYDQNNSEKHRSLRFVFGSLKYITSAATTLFNLHLRFRHGREK